MREVDERPIHPFQPRVARTQGASPYLTFAYLKDLLNWTQRVSASRAFSLALASRALELSGVNTLLILLAALSKLQRPTPCTANAPMLQPSWKRGVTTCCRSKPTRKSSSRKPVHSTSFRTPPFCTNTIRAWARRNPGHPRLPHKASGCKFSARANSRCCAQPAHG